MLEKISILCHAAIRFNGDMNLYFDPFHLKKDYNDADVIFITHSHYDHFSEEDILKVKNDKSKIVITEDLKERTLALALRKKT